MVTATAPEQQTNGANSADNGIVNFSRLSARGELPNLIKLLRDSYDWFIQEGLKELLVEMSPITDFTGNRMELYFLRCACWSACATPRPTRPRSRSSTSGTCQ